MTSQLRMFEQLACNDVPATLAPRLTALHFFTLYVHGHPPRFWRGREPVCVEEGERVLRAEGIEWREVSRVASLKEPKNMAAVFA